ncbi:MAG: hypothetical protein ABIT38_19065 [Gemmatimonadaceae bacterium]
MRLVTRLGVAQAKAARDLGRFVNRLRAGVQAAAHEDDGGAPKSAQRVAEQAEVAHLRQEVATQLTADLWIARTRVRAFCCTTPAVEL